MNYFYERQHGVKNSLLPFELVVGKTENKTGPESEPCSTLQVRQPESHECCYGDHETMSTVNQCCVFDALMHL